MIGGIYLFDIVVIAILIYGFFSGALRGFISEIASIVAIILAFVITFYYGHHLANWLKSVSAFQAYQDVVTVVAFVLLFLVVMIVVNALFGIFKYALRKPGIGVFNAIFGGVIGIIKGFVIMAFIYFVLISFVPFLNPWVENAKTAPYISGIAKKMQVFAADALGNDYFKNLVENSRDKLIGARDAVVNPQPSTNATIDSPLPANEDIPEIPETYEY